MQGDGWLANIGLRILTGRLLQNGEAPFWNAYIFGGMPLMASGYAGAFYPPNWIFAILPAGLAMNLVVITTFHIAIVGAYRYSRVLGIARVGAIVAAMVFGFGGYMVMSLGQTSNIASAAWLPWIMFSLENIYQRSITQRDSWKYGSWGALFLTLQFFAGVPQILWYTILLTGSYIFFSVFGRGFPHGRRQYLTSILWLVFLFVMLSAVQLLPMRELQLQGGRAAISYEQFSSFSFPPQQIAALLIPYLFGGATMPPYGRVYSGVDGIFITCGYAGLAGIMLAGIALFGRSREGLVRFWGIVCIASLLLSFGSFLPFNLNRFLYEIPIYNLFRASFRYMFAYTFAVSVLAGLGMDFYVKTEPGKRVTVLRYVTITLLVLFCASVGGFALSSTAKGDTSNTTLLSSSEILIPICFLYVTVAAIRLYAERAFTPYAYLIPVILFFDLLAYGHGLEWRSYKFNIDAQLTDPPSVQFIKSRERYYDSFRIVSYAGIEFGRHYEMLDYPNVSIARGLQSINGYDMLQIKGPAAIMGDMSAEGLIRDPNAFSKQHVGLDLLNVKYLLYESEASNKIPLPAERWKKLEGFGAVEVFENLSALPRAWFVDRVQHVTDADALGVIQKGALPDGSAFDPRSVALVADNISIGNDDVITNPESDVTMTSYAAQSITIHTRNSHAAFLVLSEIFYPGWTATIDGQSTTVVKTNHSLRGLVVPAGEHHIEFVFRSAAIRRGMLLTVFGLSVMILFHTLIKIRRLYSAYIASHQIAT